MGSVVEAQPPPTPQSDVRFIYTDHFDRRRPARSVSARADEVAAVLEAVVECVDVRITREPVPAGVDPSYGVDLETFLTLRIEQVLRSKERQLTQEEVVVVRADAGKAVVGGLTYIKNPDDWQPLQSGDRVVVFVSVDEEGGPLRVADGGDLIAVLPDGRLEGTKTSALLKEVSTEQELLARLRAR